MSQSYQAAVAEARHLLKRSEEDQWRLAELTWQQVEAGKSRAQWAKDIGVSRAHTGQLFSVWTEFGVKPASSRPPFAEAYNIVSGRADRTVTSSAEATVRNMPPERKAELVRDLVKTEPKVALAASDALDERHADFTANRPASHDRPETARDQHAEALALLVKLRSAKRSLSDAASLSQNIRGLGEDEMRTAVLTEVEWIRSVCDIIEAGVNGGPLDSQLQALLEAGQ